MRSRATTVEEYLSELPDDRRPTISAVREVVLANLPRGYEEAMSWGMIGYQVPLTVYPDTYNGAPLQYAALASQKNHFALYLMAVYGDEALRAWFEGAYRDSGHRMDMGKSCVRFRRLEDLPLELVGRAIAAVEVDEFVRRARGTRRTGRPPRTGQALP